MRSAAPFRKVKAGESPKVHPAGTRLLHSTLFVEEIGGCEDEPHTLPINPIAGCNNSPESGM